MRTVRTSQAKLRIPRIAHARGWSEMTTAASTTEWPTKLMACLESKRDRTLVYLFLKHQLSAKELAYLKVSDWTGSPRRTIRVPGRRKPIALSNMACEFIQSHLHHRERVGELQSDDPLFLNDGGTRMDVRCVRELLCTYDIDVEVTDDLADSLTQKQEPALRLCKRCGHGTLALILDGRRWRCPLCGFRKRNRNYHRASRETGGSEAP